MSKGGVMIAGYGLVTPLGMSAWQTFAALLAGRTIHDRAQQLHQPMLTTDPGDMDVMNLVRAVGGILPGVISSAHQTSDPAIELAERAARQALYMAGAAPEDTDCILAAGKGAVHAWCAETLNQGKRDKFQAKSVSMADRSTGDSTHKTSTVTHPTSPSRPLDHSTIAMGPVGFLAHHLQRRLGLRSVRTVVGACASSLVALHRAHLLLTHGSPAARPNRVMVVSAEATLLPLFIHSYRRLGVLPPLTLDEYRCRPLDEQHCGFVPADQASAVVLQLEDEISDQVTKGPSGQLEGHSPDSRTHSHRSNIHLLATAEANEAYDLIRAAPGMPALRYVTDQLFAQTKQTVDVLYPHAPGTAEHDAAELDVLRSSSLTNHQIPPAVYAAKGAIGHGLAPSGLAAVVLACMCAQSRRVPVMPWLTHPLASMANLRTGPVQLPAQTTHAVFASGFGGHVAGAIIGTG